MINFDNHDITAITYDDHSIQKVYGCDGHLVWESQNPPLFGGKWLATYTDGHTASAECDSTSTITDGEVTKENLVSVEFGNCITSIGATAFEKYNLLTSVRIGNNVTWIYIGAFRNCESLSSVTIPASVTDIAVEAFMNDSALAEVILEGTTPPELYTVGERLTNVFAGCDNAIFYVPDSAVETYKNTPWNQWAAFSNRIKPISEKP